MQITRATSPNLLLNRTADDDSKDTHSTVKSGNATTTTFSDYMYGPMDMSGSSGKQGVDGKNIGSALTGASSSTASLLGGYSSFLAQLNASSKGGS